MDLCHCQELYSSKLVLSICIKVPRPKQGVILTLPFRAKIQGELDTVTVTVTRCRVWGSVMYCCADVQVRCPVWCLHCCDLRWRNIFAERCNIFTDVKCDNTTFMLQSWCWLEALQAACWRVRPRLSSVLRIWSIYFFLKLNISFQLPSLIQSPQHTTYFM